MPKLPHLIVACAENRVIGRERRLPWSILEDLEHLHDLTAGQTVLLGRVCVETWPRAARDGRRAVVITRERTLARDRVQVASSLEVALSLAEAPPGELFICGGERIFNETVALARPMRLHLSLVHATVMGSIQ